MGYARSTALVDYDDFLYDDFPFPETHPETLATLATLFGLHPASPSRCRILELGCGLGGNLLPMALLLPESAFFGIDRSARQIAIARADAAALALPNLELAAMDLLDVPAELGAFDYIVCHGVYSWVPAPVQAKILQICRAHLAPEGVAYLSFNTLPGWHLRGAIRALLQREVGSAGPPQERVDRARAFLRFLAEAPADAGPAHAWLRSEIELLDQLSDAYLFYEHLAAPSEPVYFQDFAAAAQREGLQYLGDAHFPSMIPDRLGPAAARAVAARSQSFLDTEHHRDILDLRAFRRTLLCHREARVDRTISFERLKALWVSTELEPASPAPDLSGSVTETFTRPGSADLRTSLSILKAALWVLAREQPRGLPFPALAARASALVHGGSPAAHQEAEAQERLGSNLLGIFARGQIALSLQERPYVLAAGPRPTTTALVRLQLFRDRKSCTNLRHQAIAVAGVDRALLRHLDGRNTREDLARLLREDERTGALAIPPEGEPASEEERWRSSVEEALLRLGRSALLLE